MNEEKFVCPSCKKVLIEKNINSTSKNNLVIKSRLVFLNETGEVLGRCLHCKKTVLFPLNFLSKSLVLEKKKIIDL